MAYSAHLLLAFGGSAWGGQEQWQNTIRMRKELNLGDVGDTLNAFARDNMEDVVTDVKNFFNSFQGFSNQHRLEFVKFNAIRPDGRYLDQERTNQANFEPIVGSGGVHNPPQTAIVATLGTSAARGRAHAGRMFLPAIGDPAVGNDGRITVAKAQQVADLVAVFLNNLNNWPGFDGVTTPEVNIMSKLDGSHRKVNHVRVGRVLDTMRSRRSGLSEGYQTTELAD